MFRILIAILLFVNILFSQASISDINRITNEQLNKIRSELKSMDKETVTTISPSIAPVKVSPSNSTPANDLFGYDYFNRTVNFFDNIPTPANFKLGPGDEIVISLWGETNSQKKYVLNRDGSIYFPDLGFISLSNKTILEAETILRSELSAIYSTINDEKNSTKLMVELNRLKSINVFFSGAVKKPGINIVHPFSDIFTALVQAGGLNNNGSLRNVELIRDGELIESVDFYSFFMDGKNKLFNQRILEGDVIHIPTVTKRVRIDGEIIRSGRYELIKGESLDDLINFAGGLTSNAANDAILEKVLTKKERTSTDTAKESLSIKIDKASNTYLNNGDTIRILGINDSDNDVTISGRVKNPGSYPSKSNTLKDVLDLAGGFQDPSYRETIFDDEIVILRKDKSNFYSIEFTIPYSNSSSFNLEAGDMILVYENPKYDNLFTISVDGEVNKRGRFQLSNNMSVNDAINLAGGLSELANPDAIIVLENFSSYNNDGSLIISENIVRNASLDFQLNPGSKVIVNRKVDVVKVTGNVYNPGLIAYSKSLTFKKAVDLAGGHRKNTLKNSSYIVRSNGTIEAKKFAGNFQKLKPGDEIIIPKNTDVKEFDLRGFVLDTTGILTNIIAFLLLAENLKNE
tara:strand:+ start:13601 stop:15493 length:1893 start_codon:yes stop_codon:yes gene_type:complete